MRIGVLGAGGFIGSNMVEFLLDQGEHEVVGVDIAYDKIAHLLDRPGFTFTLANVHRDVARTDEIIRDVDVVIDLVAYANPSVYVTAPLEVFRVNFMANLEVVESCIRHGRRLIQYSTAEVYGKPQEGQERYSEDESDLVYGPVHKQRWIYACGKQLLERVIHAHGMAGELDYTIIRPFNFVGPRADYLVPAGTRGGPRVFAHFMSALISGGPMFLVNGGQARRSFTHIADANEALDVVLKDQRTRGQAYNIGNPGNDISIADLAVQMKEIYAELTGETPQNELQVVTGDEFYGEGYEDNGRVVPDISKLGALGWKPTRDLTTTLRDAMQFYLEHPEEAQSPDLVQRRQELANAPAGPEQVPAGR